VAQGRKVKKLSQRWDSLNNGLGELETTMIPWRQLLRELGTILAAQEELIVRGEI